MIKTQDFLFEIGCEELPPLALSNLELALGENVRNQLNRYNLTFATSKTYATPRRLAILITDLIDQQPDATLELKGPNLKVAFDENNNPTPACLGFMRSNNLEINDLTTVQDNRGSYVGATKHKLGEKTVDLLPTILMQALKNLPIPRVMRWGNGEVGFARPVHWIVMLYGETVVPCDFFAKQSSNVTYGHRFLAPQAITIAQPAKYAEILKMQGKVIADVAERENSIYLEAEKLAQQNNGTIIYDQKLLNEIACLVEYPVALLGTFPERFLQLPSEVLILVLQQQQRYFPIGNTNNKNAKLQQHFVIISNIISQNPNVVISGNEKVIVARLSDAEFFYQEDQKIPFNSQEYAKQLSKTIYQKELGSLYNKMERVSKLLNTMLFDENNQKLFAIKNANLHDIETNFQKIAMLTKNDLMTNMVGEFPELQGIMGYYYAKNMGFSEELALPLKEQYFPRFAKDALPQTTLGVLLAIAERIDTIVGIFLIGKEPTGDKDPFALRRCAFGILNIIKEHNFDLDLFALIFASTLIYQEKLGTQKFQDNIKKHFANKTSVDHQNDVYILTHAIASFIYERFRKYMDDELKTENLSTDLFNAVLDAVKNTKANITDTKTQGENSTNIVTIQGYNLKFLDFIQRMLTINKLKVENLDGYEKLTTICKRLNNILAKNPVEKITIETLKTNHYSAKETQDLCDKITLKYHQELENLFMQNHYTEYCNLLLTLVEPVNNLFDNVMILDTDLEKRTSNLQLLHCLNVLFVRIVNFGLLE